MQGSVYLRSKLCIKNLTVLNQYPPKQPQTKRCGTRILKLQCLCMELLADHRPHQEKHRGATPLNISFQVYLSYLQCLI